MFRDTTKTGKECEIRKRKWRDSNENVQVQIGLIELIGLIEALK